MTPETPRMDHYLDYAATSAIRPQQVVDAVSEFLTDCGATPGRGAHSRALTAGRIALHCRQKVAGLLGLSGDPGRIAFMHNATYALNVALAGTLKAGDTVVISDYDHNSVRRPVHALARTRGVVVRSISGSPDGTVDLSEAGRLLDGAKLLVVNEISNVLGTRMPLADLARLAHEAGALVLVDGAQSAGHVPVSHGADGADMVAFTGHKGLLGPQGTGGLWVREGVEIEPMVFGGTGGVDSQAVGMPASMPDRLEAGTVNGSGLAGLLAGCRFLEERGISAIHEEISALKRRLRDGLADIPGVRMLSPAAPDGAAIVTITTNAMDPATLSGRLDTEWGVMGRAGLHCAPVVHQMMGTAAAGAFRLSLGWASTVEDVDRAIEGVHALAKSPIVPVS